MEHANGVIVTANQNGIVDGHDGKIELNDVRPTGVTRFVSGLILPPPEIKCACFVQFSPHSLVY